MPNLEHVFTHKNLDCAIVNNETHRCGYVGVPKDHPLHGKNYNDVLEDYDISVHGGLTYSSSETSEEYPIYKKDIWWFGYDCAHYNDNLEICTLDFCIKECKNLANNLDEIAVNQRQQKLKNIKPTTTLTHTL